jgi:hypothetical protein
VAQIMEALGLVEHSFEESRLNAQQIIDNHKVPFERCEGIRTSLGGHASELLTARDTQLGEMRDSCRSDGGGGDGVIDPEEACHDVVESLCETKDSLCEMEKQEKEVQPQCPTLPAGMDYPASLRYSIEYFNEQIAHVLEVSWKCSNATAKCEEATQACQNTINERYMAQKEQNCSIDQEYFERAACSYAHAADEACVQYKECYDSAHIEWKKDMEALEKWEVTFKTESAATQRLICYLKVFQQVKGDCQVDTQAITDCQEADYENFTIKAGLTFFPIPPSPPAVCEITVRPCSPVFVAQYYGDINHKDCISCDGYPQRMEVRDARWTIGNEGKSCSEVCEARGKACDEMAQWPKSQQQFIGILRKVSPGGNPDNLCSSIKPGEEEVWNPPTHPAVVDGTCVWKAAGHKPSRGPGGHCFAKAEPGHQNAGHIARICPCGVDVLGEEERGGEATPTPAPGYVDWRSDNQLLRQAPQSYNGLSTYAGLATGDYQYSYQNIADYWCKQQGLGTAKSWNELHQFQQAVNYISGRDISGPPTQTAHGYGCTGGYKCFDSLHCTEAPRGSYNGLSTYAGLATGDYQYSYQNIADYWCKQQGLGTAKSWNVLHQFQQAVNYISGRDISGPPIQTAHGYGCSAGNKCFDSLHCTEDPSQPHVVPSYDVMNDVNLLHNADLGCNTRLNNDGCNSEADCIGKCEARPECAGFVYSPQYSGLLKSQFINNCLRSREEGGFKTYQKVESEQHQQQQAELDKGKCSDYMIETGCHWTKEYSCPGQVPAGTRGQAEDTGELGYECCCELGLFKTPPDQGL